MSTDAITDAEVVEEPGSELVPHHSGTLFRSDDPSEVIERASKVAGVLKDVLKSQRLTKNIQGREHVLVEGWTTCGAMLGVVPVVAWTRKLENGWEARVEARTLDGRIIGAAEASCTRDETTWKSRDDFALRSMAQTRATSKALRGPLGFIVTLAGFEATPSEEMPDTAPQADAKHPLGPPADMSVVGPALATALIRFVKLPGESEDSARGRAKTLSGIIKKDCGGYFPQAAAIALIAAADTDNLVPDIEPSTENW